MIGCVEPDGPTAKSRAVSLETARTSTRKMKRYAVSRGLPP